MTRRKHSGAFFLETGRAVLPKIKWTLTPQDLDSIWNAEAKKEAQNLTWQNTFHNPSFLQFYLWKTTWWTLGWVCFPWYHIANCQGTWRDSCFDWYSHNHKYLILKTIRFLWNSLHPQEELQTWQGETLLLIIHFCTHQRISFLFFSLSQMISYNGRVNLNNVTVICCYPLGVE